MAIDWDSPVGQVRNLIADTDETNFALPDEQIQSLLTMEGGRVKRAAAQALDIIATSEVLISKVIRTVDLQTDGAKVAAELRARAASLREQDDEDDAGEPWAIDVIPFDPNAPYRTGWC